MHSTCQQAVNSKRASEIYNVTETHLLKNLFFPLQIWFGSPVMITCFGSNVKMLLSETWINKKCPAICDLKLKYTGVMQQDNDQMIKFWSGLGQEYISPVLKGYCTMLQLLDGSLPKDTWITLAACYKVCRADWLPIREFDYLFGCAGEGMHRKKFAEWYFSETGLGLIKGRT